MDWKRDYARNAPKILLSVFSAQVQMHISHRSSRSAHLGEKGKSLFHDACGIRGSRWAGVSAALLWNVVLVAEEVLAMLPGNNQHGVLCQAATLHILLLHWVNPGSIQEHERTTPIYQMYPWQSTRCPKQGKAVCLCRQGAWGRCPVQCTEEWNDLKWKLSRSWHCRLKSSFTTAGMLKFLVASHDALL